MIIRTNAHARAGLLGNPSDGFYGKTISFIIRNFAAHVTLYESPGLEIHHESAEDRSQFRSIDDLVQQVNLYGYYGGQLGYCDGRHTFLKTPAGAGPLYYYSTRLSCHPGHCRFRVGCGRCRSSRTVRDRKNTARNRHSRTDRRALRSLPCS